LLPAIRNAREEARRAVCSSNQRQLVLSNLLYAQDYKEVMPHKAQGESGPAFPQPFWIPPSTINLLWDGYGLLGYELPDRAIEHVQSNCPAAALVDRAVDGWLNNFTYYPRLNRLEPATTDYCFALGMTQSPYAAQPNSPAYYLSKPQRHAPAVYEIYK